MTELQCIRQPSFSIPDTYLECISTDGRKSVTDEHQSSRSMIAYWV